MSTKPDGGPLRVAAITSGRNVPAARFRVRQLLGVLREHCVDVRELVPSVSSFPPPSRWVRPIWGALAFGSRIPLVAASHGYQMTLLQREMISTLVTLEGWTRPPRVLDVDDAIFLFRGGRSADRIARMCESVICGNEFLAEWFVHRNPNVTVIPTAVDTNRYAPRQDGREEESPVVGWIGTHSNLIYLHQIEDALATALAHCPTARLLVVSDAAPRFRSLPGDRVEFRRWSEEGEVRAIQEMSVGIMPLEDSAWARGKCSLKMLLYMACGVAVVAAPVGMNAEVLQLGRCGTPATTATEWTDALVHLLSDADARASMGKTGREVAKKHFSTDVIGARLAEHLLATAAGRRFTTGSLPDQYQSGCNKAGTTA